MTIPVALDKSGIKNFTKMFSYRIGFVNREGEDDETELDALSKKDLNELWKTLHEELNCEVDSVTYIERVPYEA